MQYTAHYTSPLGGITLAADEQGLTGLWFDGQKYFARSLDTVHRDGSLPALEAAVCWLDLYFEGRNPGFTPPLHLIGTGFQTVVWNILLKIPYGMTTTYAAVAREAAAQRGTAHMSAQAVGSAVAHNNISIIVPCHRVVGSGGSLTGYAGGISRKIALLRLEKADMNGLFVPQKSTAF
jgi:methylated-DNA-[protein]-cysteine S-methyltransferase